MQNLTERDMAYDILYAAKLAATGLMDATLEAATPACRDIFHRLHDDWMRDQWRVWQFLYHKGEYRVSEAPRAEIEGVRQRLSRLARSHGAAGRPQAVGAADYAGAAWPAARWDNSREADGFAERERRFSGGGGMNSGEWAGAAMPGAPYAGTGEAYAGTYGGSAGGPPSAYAAGEFAAQRQGGSTQGPRSGYGPATGYGERAGATMGAGGAQGGEGLAPGLREAGPVSFEPDRSLPEGTRFESDRGFAATGRQPGSAAGGRTGSAAGYGATSAAGYGATTRPEGWAGNAPAEAGRWNGGPGRGPAQGGPRR